MIRTNTLRNLRLAVTYIAAVWQFWGCSSPVQKQTADVSGTQTRPLDFFINFNGPWAFMQDPNDSSKVVAIAPFLKEHQSAYVAATNETPVSAGVYEITGLPSAILNVDPALVVVKDTIAMKTFTDVAQNSGGARYLIRLPMPKDMSSYRVGKEAVAGSWPVQNPETIQKLYTTHMTLHYVVPSFTGINFNGTTDVNKTVTFTPAIGTTGTLDIGVGPLYDLAETSCHDHGKGAFKALVSLFKVHQFIDFPGPDGQYHQMACKQSDPQNPSAPTNATNGGHLGRTGADCKAAMLYLSVTNP